MPRADVSSETVYDTYSRCVQQWVYPVYDICLSADIHSQQPGGFSTKCISSYESCLKPGVVRLNKLGAVISLLGSPDSSQVDLCHSLRYPIIRLLSASLHEQS